MQLFANAFKSGPSWRSFPILNTVIPHRSSLNKKAIWMLRIGSRFWAFSERLSLTRNRFTIGATTDDNFPAMQTLTAVLGGEL